MENVCKPLFAALALFAVAPVARFLIGFFADRELEVLLESRLADLFLATVSLREVDWRVDRTTPQFRRWAQGISIVNGFYP